jgi:hypothetical protein
MLGQTLYRLMAIHECVPTLCYRPFGEERASAGVNDRSTWARIAQLAAEFLPPDAIDGVKELVHAPCSTSGRFIECLSVPILFLLKTHDRQGNAPPGNKPIGSETGCVTAPGHRLFSKYPERNYRQRVFIKPPTKERHIKPEQQPRQETPCCIPCRTIAHALWC